LARRRIEGAYPGGIPEELGVPQGSALSCLAANLLLDTADRQALAAIERSGGTVCYFRYCDDMLLVATDPDSCALLSAPI
jgi:hypothetical protein